MEVILYLIIGFVVFVECFDFIVGLAMIALAIGVVVGLMAIPGIGPFVAACWIYAVYKTIAAASE